MALSGFSEEDVALVVVGGRRKRAGRGKGKEAGLRGPGGGRGARPVGGQPGCDWGESYRTAWGHLPSIEGVEEWLLGERSA